MTTILNLLERFGRKSVLLDFYHRVLMERFHLFYFYDEQKPRWFHVLPNVMLHYFPGPISPDARYDQHRHPWNTYGFVLKGGYTEIINWNEEKIHKAGDFVHLRHDVNHRIVSVVPGTWTLWCHGFRKQAWIFDMKACDSCCDACKTKRGGQCFRKSHPHLTLPQIFDLADGAVQWVRCDPKTIAKVKRRREALGRVGVSAPSKETAASMMEFRFAKNEQKVLSENEQKVL